MLASNVTTNVGNSAAFTTGRQTNQKNHSFRPGVKVSVLLGIISYLEKAPEIHKVKTSCGIRDIKNKQTLPGQIKHCFEQEVT